MPTQTVASKATLVLINLSESEKKKIRELNSKGIAYVNNGQLKEAIEIFSSVLNKHNLYDYVALVARGSAHSLAGNTQFSIDDFTMAVQVHSEYPDGWKRRGQTYGRTGQYKKGIFDLTQASKLMFRTLTMSSNNKVDKEKEEEEYLQVMEQLSILLYKYGDYVKAIKNIKKVIRQREKISTTSATSNTSLSTMYNYLGQCYVSTGRPLKAIKMYKQVLRFTPNEEEMWINIVQAGIQIGKSNIVIDAYNEYNNMIHNMKKNSRLRMMHLMLSYYFSSGQLNHVYQLTVQCLTINSSDGYCLYLQGMSFMSSGQLYNAIEIFRMLGDKNANDDDDNDHNNHYSFYQLEWAIYQYRNYDRNLLLYNADNELNGIFKEYFSMNEHPSLLDEYTPQVMVDKRENPMKDTIDHVIAIHGIQLQMKHFSAILHLNSSGFINNARQHRQAGLAILIIGHQLRNHWNQLNHYPHTNGKKVSNSGSSQSIFNKNDKHDNQHNYGWRDMFDVAVKWRQIVSCNDSVWWIDQLDEFNKMDPHGGYGLSTPLKIGQLNVVRYYTYFRQAFNTLITLLPQQYSENYNLHSSFLLSSYQLEQIPYATSLEDLYTIIRKDHFFVTTRCRSEYVPGKLIQGTRLTVHVSHDPIGYEFSISTPGTPNRWKEYDLELKHQFNNLIKVVRMNAYHLVPTIALKIFFYWCNFAPLTRGSAATGYVVLHSILLASGYIVNATLFQNVQLDWEAILTTNPTDFVSDHEKWLLDHLITIKKDSKKHDWLDEWSNSGNIDTSFNSYRKMYYALNYGNDIPDIGGR
jgi:tetratricopeptide (TPR) repeat protein